MFINCLLLFAHVSALELILEPLIEASIILNTSKSLIQEDGKVKLTSNERSVLEPLNEVCTNGRHEIPNGGTCNNKDDCESGWCEGDVVAGCNGICRAKRRNGEAAWKDWQASCEDGKSQCGTCTSDYKDLANGKSCSGWEQCASDWCEGDVVEGCNGICRPKRKNGEEAWKDWQASCESGKSQCGTCTSDYTDLPNGASCSGWEQCESDWCEGHSVIDCRGTCQARRHNGHSAWHGSNRSCHSGREQCGVCTSGDSDLGSGSRCSRNSNCRSGWCGCGSWFCASADCSGTCD